MVFKSSFQPKSFYQSMVLWFFVKLLSATAQKPNSRCRMSAGSSLCGKLWKVMECVWELSYQQGHRGRGEQFHHPLFERAKLSLSHGGIHVVVLNIALDLVCDMRSEVAAETTDQADAAEFRLSEALLALTCLTFTSMKNMGRDTGDLPIQFTLLYGSSGT